MKRKDGKEAIISAMLYVPSMSRNLISLGQLLEKNYTMKLENLDLKVFDAETRLILKASLSNNKNLKSQSICLIIHALTQQLQVIIIGLGNKDMVT